MSRLEALRADCPLALEDLLTVLAERDTLRHLSLARNQTGAWQASFQAAGSITYRVETHRDPVTALYAALGPAYGHLWEEIIGGPASGALDPNLDVL